MFCNWHNIEVRKVILNSRAMISTFIKLSLRKIWHDRSFSALSITGLSLATVSCTIIFLYVTYERSFDNFRSKNVYRVSYHGFQNNVETEGAAQSIPALAPALKQDIPVVKNAVRLAHTGPFMSDPVMEYGEKKFREGKIYYADDGFLSMFSYKMISGSVEKALSMPDQVAVSKTVAEKYFGKSDPIGKALTFYRGEIGAKQLIVTGVFEDVPMNSHLHTDFVISFTSLGMNLDNDWDWGNFYTYIEVQPGIDGVAVESQIPTLLNKYIGKYIAESAKAGYRIEFLLKPIQSIHLESKLWGELEVNGDLRTVNFLNTIAIFILLIAWINYLNFSIARSAENSKEISIRKINGSSRGQLIGQLLTDSAIINFFAVCISIAIIQVSLPVLKNMVGLPDAIALGWKNGLVLIMIFLAGTLCSGLYPALFISRLNPVALLKSKVPRSAMSLTLNKALIVFQFTATVILVIGTITVFLQLRFMRNKELGLDIEQTLIVKGPSVKDSTYQTTLSFFTNETKKLSGISSFALASSIPGQELHWGRSYSRKDDPQNSIGASIIAIDENFFNLFDARFIAGRNYPDGTSGWQDAIIINETAAKQLGYTDASHALDQIILWNENDNQTIPKRVIGVVNDFNQQSLRKQVGPIVFTLRKYIYAPWAGEFYVFKIKPSDLRASIGEIEHLWKDVYPQNPFDYFFLDEYFDAQYKNDDQFGKAFTIFSGLAIFISSLGLFGLTAYMTAMRTKEIGVRKVLGSSAFQLVRLLSAHYLMLVLIAFGIACPIAMYIMNTWLSQFAYHIPLSIWIFIGAGTFCFIVAMLTVGVKSWQSATMDPAKALKYE
jgi:putative ABC transport system permease protein